MTATIDGRPVAPRPGETILAAAARVGIAIPTLCHRAGSSAPAGCRICVVEDGHGRVLGACHVPVEDGMAISTATPRLQRLRADALRLQTDTIERAGADSELVRLCGELGVEPPASTPASTQTDRSQTYVRFDPTACIACRRCVVACAEIQGQFVYSMAERGGATRLVYGPSQRLGESACTACGACVDACPTGALFDRDREREQLASAAVDSVCGYCGVGCRIHVESADDRVLRIGGVPEAAVNRGHLCAKGRFAHGYVRHRERLRRPLLRDGDGFREVGWDEAIGFVAQRLQAILHRHGPSALGAVTSSRSTNEAAYLLQKLVRMLGSNNVDCCARVCHSSTALGLQTATGTGAATASYDDIERAGCIVVAGANPTEAHPVVGARIKQAAIRGASLVVIDPRRIELADYADVHLQLQPGTNVALFNALAKLLIEAGNVDQRYLDERTEGLDELRALLQRCDLDEAARRCRVDRATIERAAAILGRAGPVLFVHGLGLSEQTQGTQSVMTLCNLGLLTGSMGKPGAGMLPLRGQNNVQGNADMGGMPGQVTGYQRVDDEDVRQRLRELWGVAPPEQPGLTIPEMLAAARAGTLRALWVAGEDLAQSDPDQTRVLEALAKLELLVVQDPFLAETSRLAHLVLPSATALEQEGTFTNAERRIQHVRPAIAPPGEARPDWEVVVDVARALGLSWSYAGPGDVMDEIAKVAPASFGGVRYDRLGSDGLQWPCPDPEHPGTARLHEHVFLRGRGQLVAIEQAPASVGQGYPYVLVTGRTLHQYNVGTMTRRTPQQELSPRDVLEIHPDDAARDGVADGAEVVVESAWGAVRVVAQHSLRVLTGTLFLTFHQPETHANRVIGPDCDPLSKCPSYKVTAVRVSAADRDQAVRARPIS